MKVWYKCYGSGSNKCNKPIFVNKFWIVLGTTKKFIRKNKFLIRQSVSQEEKGAIVVGSRTNCQGVFSEQMEERCRRDHENREQQKGVETHW